MELNAQQLSPISTTAPQTTVGYWTSNREEICNWLHEQSPSLGELYKGAVSLTFGDSVSGRVRFIAHAVREIRNRLPDGVIKLSSQNSLLKDSNYLQYSKEIDQLVKIWKYHGFSLDQPFLSDGINIEATIPPSLPDVPIPNLLFLEIQKLLQKHVTVSITNKQKAELLFETLIPKNQSLQAISRPIVEHWWNVTEWFMKKTHDNGAVDADCSELELVSQFEQFESFLSALARSFYNTTDELDKILEDTNS